jgi:hypothetical protein
VCLYFVVRKDLNLSVVVWYQRGECVLARRVHTCTCTSASSPCIDVVSGLVSMHVVSFCVLHDLSLVPGTISAASPLAIPTPIGGRMPSVASGPCGVSVSFIVVVVHSS